jgi:hypothetical protein
VGPEMTAPMLMEYLHLWTEMDRVQLSPEANDSITWSWEKDGNFSTRSAYAARFWGREVVPTAQFTWGSRAPLRCRFFIWVALQNRCWTADRLARRGLDHPEQCPFCDQEEETINHLLLDCVFASEVWATVAAAAGKPDWAPRRGESIVKWCAETGGSGRASKETRTVSTLVLWELWKHRNAIVFDAASPSTSRVISNIRAEGMAWKQAGMIKEDASSFLGKLAEWDRRSS